MGWRFKWLSSHGSDFNFDYHVSSAEEEKANDKMFYNYQTDELMSDEMPGLSVFCKDQNGDESPESTMDWVRRHDQCNA